MEFEADTGGYAMQIARPATTIKGEVPADNLFKVFSADALYDYENQGFQGSVKNSWFAGSPIEKAYKLSREVGCELIIDDGSFIILPEGKARSGNAVLLTRDTGLIGYPTFNQDGIACRCAYNPTLAYGGMVRIEKSLTPKANGNWRITKLTHDLSAYNPGGGKWESQIEAAFPIL